MSEKSWTINYLAGEGSRLTGKLLVSGDEVRFRALYDSSFKTIAKSIGLIAGSLAASGGHVAFLREDGDDAEIVIPRESIARAEADKKGLMKRVVVTTEDGSEFVFEYGVMSVKKLVAAINGK